MNHPTHKISITEQQPLIERVLVPGQDLLSELDKIGLCAEDLRYVNYPDFQIPRVGLKWLDEVPRVPNRIPAVSFFAGAGQGKRIKIKHDLGEVTYW